MSIVIAAGFFLLMLLVSSRQESFFRKAFFGVATLVLISMTGLALSGNLEMFLKVPGTRYETMSAVEVPVSGAMYLESTQSPFLDNKFYVTGDNMSEVSEWLKSTSKSVHMKVVSGDRLLYSRNLGVYSEGMENDIKSVYSSWQSNGSIPLGKTRYWFLLFYLEV